MDPQVILLIVLTGMSTSLGAALVFFITTTSHKIPQPGTSFIKLHSGISLSSFPSSATRGEIGLVRRRKRWLFYADIS